LAELYGTEVSPDLISRVTDAVVDEVREWQNQPLDAVYPVAFFDAMRVKIRDEGLVKNKAVYVALALNPDGEKDVLGLWIEQTEGAKFWLKVAAEIDLAGTAFGGNCAAWTWAEMGRDGSRQADAVSWRLKPASRAFRRCA
jgi:putative transposase